jgi:predicted phosphodiesterase
MRILCLSDLHLEFGSLRFPKAKEYFNEICDVIVLAGDIHVGAGAYQWIEHSFPSNIPIIYIAGNHEFYNQEIREKYSQLKERAKLSKNIHFLQNEVFEIAEVLFVGATLWTDFKLYGANDQSLNMHFITSKLNDFRLIKNGNRPITPEFILEQHNTSRAFLEQHLNHKGGKVVFVTHHCPSEKSGHIEKFGTDLTYGYCSNLEGLIDNSNINLWIHGHSHESSDYMIDKTRVVCNPRGYHGREENPNFDVYKIITV